MSATTHTPTASPTRLHLEHVVLVDPSELTDDAQDDLAHYLRVPQVPAGPGYVEALCGETLKEDDPESFTVTRSPAPAGQAPDGLTFVCSRCQRVADVVQAVGGGRR